jgi:hypothetical protein
MTNSIDSHAYVKAFEKVKCQGQVHNAKNFGTHGKILLQEVSKPQVHTILKMAKISKNRSNTKVRSQVKISDTL